MFTATVIPPKGGIPASQLKPRDPGLRRDDGVLEFRPPSPLATARHSIFLIVRPYHPQNFSNFAGPDVRAITKIGGGADGTQTHDLLNANQAL